MKRFELNNLKNALGKSFSAFFPTLSKKVEQITSATTSQRDLVLVSVYRSQITKSAKLIRNITGWSIQSSTNFVKSGPYPKVIQYNLQSDFAVRTGTKLTSLMEKGRQEKTCIIEIR